MKSITPLRCSQLIHRLLSVGGLTAILLLVGCRPLQTVMRGAMTMNGDMSMRGDMQMSGQMDMRGEMTTLMKSDNTASRLAMVAVYDSPAAIGSGKVVVLDVDGLMVNKNLSGFGSMGENPVALFREKLDAIAMDPAVKALVLRINSPGGGVTASDMMAKDLQRLTDQRDIRVVTCFMDVGTGGAYYLANATDAIVAHPTSVIGGIGVILNLYTLENVLGNLGVFPIPIKSGELIDVATPERMMEEGERELLQSMAADFHDRFKRHVSQARPGVDQQMFDGRIMTGEQAKASKLVDEVGYMDDAIALARRLAGLPDDASVYMLRRKNDRAYTALDITPNKPTMSSLLPISVPGMERSELPTFLYMWQGEPGFTAASGG